MPNSLTQVCVRGQVVLDHLADRPHDELPVSPRVHRLRVLQRDHVPRRLRAAHREPDQLIEVGGLSVLPLARRRLGPGALYVRVGGDDVNDGLAVAERVLLGAHLRRRVLGVVKDAEAVAQPLVSAGSLICLS